MGGLRWGAVCLTILLLPVALQAGTAAAQEPAVDNLASSSNGVVASASVSSTGHGPEQLNDDDLGTYWQASKFRKGPGEWVAVRFNATPFVDEIHLHMVPAYVFSDFDLYLDLDSDGAYEANETVDSVAGNAAAVSGPAASTWVYGRRRSPTRTRPMWAPTWQGTSSKAEAKVD